MFNLFTIYSNSYIIFVINFIAFFDLLICKLLYPVFKATKLNANELIDLIKIDSSANNTDNEDNNLSEDIDVKKSTEDQENVNSNNDPFEKSINNVLDSANKKRIEQLKKFKMK